MKYFICLLLCTLNLSLFAQDLDNDGLDDAFELAIAKKLAPEWRFHASTGSGSNQNNDEEHFPSSVEYLNQYNLRLRAFGINDRGFPFTQDVPIADVRNISRLRNPITDEPVTSGPYGNPNLRIVGFPEYTPGEPLTFPTYFRCYKVSETEVAIGYLLYYPMDYKGKYCIGIGLFGACIGGWLRPGKHRGDWEGVNVLVSGVRINDTGSLDQASIKHIKYSGHGTKRYITGDSHHLRTVNRTHPKVYITWGAHTPYPEPGNFENYKFRVIGIGFNWYDDYFLGNGLVVQAWNRSLLNLGEVGQNGNPMPGMDWIRFRGLWGPDNQHSEAKSPSGPPQKSAWSHNLSAEHYPWEEAILDEVSSEYWARGYHADCRSFLAGVYRPNPRYNCDAYLDVRTTCPDASNPQIPHGTLPSALSSTPPRGLLGVFPGKYRSPRTLRKPMTIRAIEGPVTLRQ